MRCNGLPNAYDPGDLRKYIHMWDLENEKFDAREQNWLLRTDERTVLTQNRMIPNVTRAHLQQQQPNLGDIYAKRAREVLGVSIEWKQTQFILSRKGEVEIANFDCRFWMKLTKQRRNRLRSANQSYKS